jgi:tetratricopeptide (TPR) repeat protein
MNNPIRSYPLGNWDSSSFRSAYHVDSEVPSEETRVLIWEGSDTDDGFPPEKAEYYTRYGKDEKIKELALTVTRGARSRAEKVGAIVNFLKYEYRYSLKPGVASDGNQLHHFLFESKKGYCSYFAFSMALMCRSLGIPARVVAGFYIDPATHVFSLYPVRSDMAHAWVEVHFPGQGWIEFDPTSNILAAGEDVNLSAGFDVRQYNALAQEILQNADKLHQSRPEDIKRHAAASVWDALGRAISSLFSKGLPRLIAGAAALLILTNALLPRLRCALSREARRRVILSFRLMLKDRAYAGFKPAEGKGSPPWKRCATLDRYCSPQGSHARCYQAYSRALYAPSFTPADEREFNQALVEARADFYAKAGRARSVFSRLRWPFPGKYLALGLALCLLPLAAPASYAEGISTDQPSQPASGAQAMLEEANLALLSENYDDALRLLNSAAQTFPKDKNVFKKLGDVYRDKEFYALALTPLKRAEGLDPKDADTLYDISGVLACLGRDADSADYLRRTLAIEPDNVDVLSDLGWIYFKLHQVDKGISLMESARRRLGNNINFEMTLGTLYSEKYDYENSKRNYEEAIKTSLKLGNDGFAGVAYYNLSILESKFHHFEEATRLTRLSIQKYDRASAHLALGELALRRMDLDSARAEYEAANATDKSPLSSIALADIALASGRLAEAVSICENNLKRTDYAWMVNFGTDQQSHRAEIYHILNEAYSGLARVTLRSPAPGPLEKISGVIQAGGYWLKSWYGEHLYRKLSKRIADVYRAEGNRLLANVNYYNALEDYPAQALRHLERAQNLEGKLVPAALPLYDEEKYLTGHELQKAAQGMDRFDQTWERDSLVDCLTRLGKYQTARWGQEGLKETAERLYSINPAALPQAGVSLPVRLDLGESPNFLDAYASLGLAKTIVRAGFCLSPKAKYSLRIEAKGDTLTASLSLVSGGAEEVSLTRKYSDFSAKSLCDFANAFLNQAFKPGSR